MAVRSADSNLLGRLENILDNNEKYIGPFVWEALEEEFNRLDDEVAELEEENENLRQELAEANKKIEDMDGE